MAGEIAAAGIGAVGGALGMIGQNKRAKKQHNRQKELMGIQLKNQQQLNKQGQQLQMQTWRDTNYGAQMDMMKEAGLNPALMYGMRVAVELQREAKAVEVRKVEIVMRRWILEQVYKLV